MEKESTESWGISRTSRPILLYLLLLHPSWQLWTIKAYKSRLSCSVFWHRIFHITWSSSPAMLTLVQTERKRIKKFKRQEEERNKREMLRKRNEKKKEQHINPTTKKQQKFSISISNRNTEYFPRKHVFMGHLKNICVLFYCYAIQSPEHSVARGDCSMK